METKKKGSKVRGQGSKVKKAAVAKAPAKTKEARKGPREFAVPVYNMKGKEIVMFALDKNLFNGEVNRKVLYQAVVMYNANRRGGNADTKTRGEISGEGKKPYRQKGTGQARAGSTRSPLWRHGGTVFGPHPRDYSYDLPKKVKRLAFLSSINSKLDDDKLIGIDSVAINEPKTKNFAAILEALKLEGKSLFVLESMDDNVKRASRNIPNVSLKNYKDINTMDVLGCDTVVMSKGALDKLPERFRE